MNKAIAFLPVMGFVFMMLALAGCAGKTHVEVIRPPLNIAPQMFQCESASNRPSGETIMESDVARYITSLEFSQKDCALRLKELSIIIKCYNDKGCNVDKLVEYAGLIRQEKAAK